MGIIFVISHNLREYFLRYSFLLIKISQLKVKTSCHMSMLEVKPQPLKFCSTELPSLPDDAVWSSSDLKLILNIYSILLQWRLFLLWNLKFKMSILWPWEKCFLLSEIKQSILLDLKKKRNTILTLSNFGTIFPLYIFHVVETNSPLKISNVNYQTTLIKDIFFLLLY